MVCFKPEIKGPFFLALFVVNLSIVASNNQQDTLFLKKQHRVETYNYIQSIESKEVKLRLNYLFNRSYQSRFTNLKDLLLLLQPYHGMNEKLLLERLDNEIRIIDETTEAQAYYKNNTATQCKKALKYFFEAVEQVTASANILIKQNKPNTYLELMNILEASRIGLIASALEVKLNYKQLCQHPQMRDHLLDSVELLDAFARTLDLDANESRLKKILLRYGHRNMKIQ